MVLSLQENYQAWEVDEAAFPVRGTWQEQAIFLVRYAILASNSHNSQPWLFRIHKREQVIDLLPDFARSLPHSDPENRQLFVSLGCALGTLEIAAAYFRFETQISYYLDQQAHKPHIRIQLRAVVGQLPVHLEQRTRLFSSIVSRRMNRAPYEKDRPIPDDLVRVWQSYHDDPEVTLSFIDRERFIFHQFLSLVYQGTVGTQGNPGIIEEWGRWFRPTDTLLGDGVPPFDFTIPDNPMTVAEQAKATEALFETAPLFLVIGTHKDDAEHWARAGRVLAFVSLAVQRAGAAQAPWGAVVEDRDSAGAASRMLDVPHIAYFSRLGYTDMLPHHSPRRAVEEVVQYAE